jgi:2-polyprenyl-6-methoxyphenol hydroxylase-like FAD-dependent oxidoreductase
MTGPSPSSWGPCTPTRTIESASVDAYEGAHLYPCIADAAAAPAKGPTLSPALVPGTVARMARVRAIVVGGGIAGLAAALALTRAGVATDLVAPASHAPRRSLASAVASTLLEALGCSPASPRRALQLWSNAVAALAHLGLEVRAAWFHRLELVEIRAYNGELLWTLPVGPWSGETPSGMVWEDELVEHLIHRLADDDAAKRLLRHTYGRVCGLHDDGARVRATLAGGKTLDADLLVGADGFDSLVR